MFWAVPATEKIVQNTRRQRSQNKTKHLGQFSPLLLCPNKELLHLTRPASNGRKSLQLDLLLSTEQEALPSPHYLCPTGLWGRTAAVYSCQQPAQVQALGTSSRDSARSPLPRLCSALGLGENVTIAILSLIQLLFFFTFPLF